MNYQEIKFQNKSEKYSIFIGENSINLLPGKIKTLCPETKKIGLIVDKNLPFDWTKEKRIQFFNSLDEAKIFELEPGDLLYIPERLMHYERGEGERMYLNFPLITKGPHSSYNPII